MGISEISSSNNVPPSAALKIPLFVVDAPVNEPFSWPNNRASNIFSGIAAQFTATKPASARFE